jgi:DNA repair protein RadB
LASDPDGSHLSLAHQAIPTGCAGLDEMLHGGFSKGEVALLYGEAATGKTTTVIHLAISAAKLGFKTLYVDSDHSFTQQRFHQIAKSYSQAASELIMIFLPETFAEQRKIIESLESYLTPALGLVIIDSVSSLYRASFSKAESVFTLNRDLGRQLAYLSQLSSTDKVPCIITSQVHTRLTPPTGEIEPVARRALFHFPRTILRLSNTPRPSVKEFHLERLEGSDTKDSCLVTLTEDGLEEVAA